MKPVKAAFSGGGGWGGGAFLVLEKSGVTQGCLHVQAHEDGILQAVTRGIGRWGRDRLSGSDQETGLSYRVKLRNPTTKHYSVAQRTWN